MTPFETRTVEAARAFLQTVVVVDNMAQFQSGEPEVAETLESPDPFGAVPAPMAGAVAANDTEKSLDAGAISSSFAAKGLICSVIRPLKNDALIDAVVKSAERSDILVLDWQMFDDGDAAVEIIKKLAVKDRLAGGKLRLVAVYTSESPLSSVADKIAAMYPSVTRDVRPLTFCKDNTRIILLSKDSSPNAPHEASFAASEAELPERLIEEFAQFTQGLLPNATMAAIAGIRENTHRVLARFDRSMDGPMLTHRTLIPSSEDAEAYISELILSEISAQMPVHSAVSKYAGPVQIAEYLSHRRTKGHKPEILLAKDGSKKKELTDAELINVIENGHPGLPEAIAVNKDELFQRLYLCFADNIETAKSDNVKFAVRSKLKRDATSVNDSEGTWPKLRLGALLKFDGKFWLCLTPLCDSTRIPLDGGTFLFAELTLHEKGKFDIVIPVDNDFVSLELARQRTSVLSRKFKPAANLKDIIASVSNGVARFYPVTGKGTVNRKAPFVWLGELKPLQAQRFAQIYASNLARVGLDDFEWHRTQASNL